MYQSFVNTNVYNIFVYRRRLEKSFCWTVVNYIKLICRKSKNLDFPGKWNNKKKTILKSIDSLRGYICIKVTLVSHFCGGSSIRTNFYQFFNVVKNWISSNNCFITSTSGPLGTNNVSYLCLIKRYFILRLQQNWKTWSGFEVQIFLGCFFTTNRATVNSFC